MPSNSLTQERLKELLHYNHDTGVFTWLVRRGGAMKAGSVAGAVDCPKRNFIQYNRIKIDYKSYRAHRLAWLYLYGCWPLDGMDHIDGDGLNNRIKNLREADQGENCKNKRLYRSNSSGVVGVNWAKDRNQWRAQIRSGKVQINIGQYDNLFDAVCARKSTEIKLGFHLNHGRSQS